MQKMGDKTHSVNLKSERPMVSTTNIARVREELTHFTENVHEVQRRITKLKQQVHETHRVMNKRDSNIVNDITAQVREVIHQV